jgi:SEC-C motif-containing protein
MQGAKPAEHAEALMRSRFSAYKVKNYQYILSTYASPQRAKLSVKILNDSAIDTHWLSLQVLAHQAHDKTSQVEFKALYQLEGQFYLMHELSYFVIEAGKWVYTHGEMQKGSGKLFPQRNSQCLCGSGKKFKQCCIT